MPDTPVLAEDAARRAGLEQATCDIILEALEDARFLKRDPAGRLRAPGSVIYQGPLAPCDRAGPDFEQRTGGRLGLRLEADRDVVLATCQRLWNRVLPVQFLCRVILE